MWYDEDEKRESGESSENIQNQNTEVGNQQSQWNGGNNQPNKWNGDDNKKSNNSGGKKRHPILITLVCALIFGLVGGGTMAGINYAANLRMSADAGETETTEEVTEETTDATEDASAAEEVTEEAEDTAATEDTEYTVEEIAAKCKSSVVAITTLSVSEVQSFFGTYETEQEGAGSGVIIGKTDTELLIATNNHVVSGASSLTVCFNDDENAVVTASVKGTDEQNDLAIVSISLDNISSDILNSISIATISTGDDLADGQQVVAIGNALGEGQSVTTGIISALDREVVIDDYTYSLIQTDAAINPGNSGGGLFNMKGELIGINSSKYASEEVEGMGFAIPMSTAQGILENLASGESRVKLDSGYGYLNVRVVTVDENTAASYNMVEGVYVNEVIEGGAAANAGMQVGDIITALDNRTITTADNLTDALKYYPAGETVDVVVMRNNGTEYKEVTLSVTLDEAPDSTSTQDSQTQDSQNSDAGNGQDGNAGGNNGNGNNGGSGNGNGSGSLDDLYEFFGNIGGAFGNN